MTDKYVRTEWRRGSVTLTVETCDSWDIDGQLTIRGMSKGTIYLEDLQDLIDLLLEYKEGKE